MKVVLFCGGLGTRLGGLTEDLPKPLVKIGYRPILWHLMKYYAHFGHQDFILCLGYRADKIKNYFLNYDECLSNDFTMTNGGKDILLNNHDITDWRITFVDTGLKGLHPFLVAGLIAAHPGPFGPGKPLLTQPYISQGIHGSLRRRGVSKRPLRVRRLS
jgi:NDP-sugar pyrophosphorylase family protein